MLPGIGRPVRRHQPGASRVADNDGAHGRGSRRQRRHRPVATSAADMQVSLARGGLARSASPSPPGAVSRPGERHEAQSMRDSELRPSRNPPRRQHHQCVPKQTQIAIQCSSTHAYACSPVCVPPLFGRREVPGVAREMDGRRARNKWRITGRRQPGSPGHSRTDKRPHLVVSGLVIWLSVGRAGQ